MTIAVDFMVKVHVRGSCFAFTSKVYAINVERNQFLISGTAGNFYWVDIDDCLLHDSHEEEYV